MIRPITPEDRVCYLELCREFYNSPAVLQPVPEAHFEKTFSQLAAGSPFVKGYLLETEAGPAGYALLAVTYSQEAGGQVWWIEELYLRPEFQGKGLGTELFRYLERIRPASVTRFRLEIEPENRDARRLYERLGFSELGYAQMVREFPQKTGI